MVQRTFPEGLQVPVNQDGDRGLQQIISRNAEDGVTWVCSYVSQDKTRTSCVYDAPNAEAIRKVATRNGLPVDHITEVRVLDPYFYF